MVRNPRHELRNISNERENNWVNSEHDSLLLGEGPPAHPARGGEVEGAEGAARSGARVWGGASVKGKRVH